MGCALAIFLPSTASAAGSYGVRMANKQPIPPSLARDIKAIINIFEVGSPTADYTYVEDLGDGRGFTLTQYGLCTNEPEVARVIERYIAVAPQSSLSRYLGALPPYGSGTDMSQLDGFPELWRKEIDTYPALSKACDEVADALYFQPALEEADAIGLYLPIGLAVFYDTLLQHGGGDDADSFGAILERTLAQVDRPTPTSTPEFLRAFLSVRRTVLLAPANAATAEVWRRSVTRLDALLGLLEENPRLRKPIKVRDGPRRIVLR